MSKMVSNRSFYDRKYIIFFIIFGLLYFLWYGLIVGITATNYGFFAFITILFFGSERSRQFFYAFLPFFIYLMLYDSNRILHEYNIFPVHNKCLYDLEVSWFGIDLNGTRATLNEYFYINQHKLLDFISGVFYISWMPFPLIFASYVFFKGRSRLSFQLWTAFLITNLFGFIIYITLPAAPPWYYLEYGPIVDFTTPGNPAGLLRFDEIINLPIYQNMYSNASNVFGALPSMHAAFPVLLTFYSLRYNNKFLSSLFALSILGIWFGAVYSSHHYIIDLLMGVICAIIGILITEYWFKNHKEDSMLANYLDRLNGTNSASA